MMKRWLAILLVLASLIGLGLFGLAILPSRYVVSRENLQRIEVGMTVHEVEAILGKPATNKIALPVTGDVVPGEILHWQNKDGSQALVYFHFDDGRVYHKDWWDSNETILQKLRRWLRL